LQAIALGLLFFLLVFFFPELCFAGLAFPLFVFVLSLHMVNFISPPFPGLLIRGS
jgi:hypothetical protein